MNLPVHQFSAPSLDARGHVSWIFKAEKGFELVFQMVVSKCHLQIRLSYPIIIDSIVLLSVSILGNIFRFHHEFLLLRNNKFKLLVWMFAFYFIIWNYISQINKMLGETLIIINLTLALITGKPKDIIRSNLTEP